MIAVLQRVKKAAVTVDGQVVGSCGEGLCILLGVAKGDTEKDAEALAQKVAGLRIFCDENDKMNLSVKDIDGEALVISNFTLLAAYKKGKRPDYMGAAAPQEANRLYEYFCQLCTKEIRRVEKGVFGADMSIDLCCDGPVTIVMDSNVLFKNNGQ